MRIVKILTVLLAAAAFFALLAQDPEFQGWMKTAAANNGKLNKGVAAKDSGAADAAASLEQVFKQVEAYWQAKGVADAVGFAKQAHMAAAAAGKAVASGDWEKAAAEGKNVGAQCAGCHAAHREKGDSGFKMK